MDLYREAGERFRSHISEAIMESNVRGSFLLENCIIYVNNIQNVRRILLFKENWYFISFFRSLVLSLLI